MSHSWETHWSLSTVSCRTEVLPLFYNCLEATRSDAVKICVVKACITLVSEVRVIRPIAVLLLSQFLRQAPTMPWIVSPEDLRVAVSGRITAISRVSQNALFLCVYALMLFAGFSHVTQ